MANKPPGYIFGRPTKYNDAMLVKANEYLEQCMGNAAKGIQPRTPFIEEALLGFAEQAIRAQRPTADQLRGSERFFSGWSLVAAAAPPRNQRRPG